ncbi:zinc finger protein 64 homolog, isoforms 1 and 2-like isoform X2 [Centruroides sculpturatus]|uniref:zinc finger protein 64 homolog, isoforms 1 and 2-like isoform X2 n=1 Tax=Centruroides sculpturatus TaxID=218467 RepID=UPI000C6D7C23|nr:zinc finger protein 64 homolog, isoforms 1 and 2-like isoform X2 [Centruroides sculpturatus]
MDIHKSQKSSSKSCDGTSAAVSNKIDDKIQNAQHKQSSEMAFRCDLCNFNTSSKVKLSIHKRRHADKEKLKSCDERSAAVSSETDDKSQNAQHKQETEMAFRCDLCNFSTWSKEKWFVHKQRHDDENNLKKSAEKTRKGG